MTRTKWVVLGLFFLFIVCCQYAAHRLLNLNSWNSFTFIVDFVIFTISLIGLPVLVTQKRRNPAGFVQGFLVFTVFQMLMLMAVMAAALFKLNTSAANLFFQLLCVFFPVLIFQSIFLIKSAGK